MEKAVLADIPSQVRPVLEAFIAALASQLPGLVTGLYLHGSLALGDYQPRCSDLDFLAFINRPCTRADLARLAGIHRALRGRYPHPAFDGDYHPWENLLPKGNTGGPYANYHDGKLRCRQAAGINPVTLWTVKNRGITLIVPDPGSLDFEVDGETLRAYMLRNLNTYWWAFTRKPRRILWLFFDAGIQWAILGVLRQYTTLKEQVIVSKIEAGDYGLSNLPGNWHRLIQEALDIRQYAGTSLYRHRLTRAREAVQFLTFMIGYCNTHFR